MRLLILTISFFSCFTLFSQNDEFQVWTEVGLKGDLIKRMDWMVDLNTRFGRFGVEKILPEVGVDYKVKKWFKPSITYRSIIAKNQIGNYKLGHRINLNANFKKGVKRFEFAARIRYQFAFAKGASPVEYDADFDQAIRIKPSIEYDINNSIFTPKVSADFYYDPVYGPNGQRFTKIRLAAGASLELKGPHSFSFKYQVDKKLHDYGEGLLHVLALSYGYKF